jgi:hypothetical protein
MPPICILIILHRPNVIARLAMRAVKRVVGVKEPIIAKNLVKSIARLNALKGDASVRNRANVVTCFALEAALVQHKKTV